MGDTATTPQGPCSFGTPGTHPKPYEEQQHHSTKPLLLQHPRNPPKPCREQCWHPMWSLSPTLWGPCSFSTLGNPPQHPVGDSATTLHCPCSSSTPGIPRKPLWEQCWHPMGSLSCTLIGSLSPAPRGPPNTLWGTVPSLYGIPVPSAPFPPPPWVSLCPHHPRDLLKP